MIPAVPYWRLSAFYFCYFCLLGGLIPYWSLYLSSLGFDHYAIGVLMAILMLTKIIAPNIWGWWGDRSQQRLKIIRFGALTSLLVFVAIFYRQDFLWLILIMLGFSFFWNAILPQYEVITLNYLQQTPQYYSRVRLWGSLGFISTVMCLGILLDHYGIGLLPWALTFILLSIFFSSFLVSEAPLKPSTIPQASFTTLLRRPSVIAFFVVCFLMQISHGPYYTFFTLYMDQLGYSRTLIGQLWAVGVVAEIGVFLLMHRLLPRFGARVLLLVSIVLTIIRWLLIGMAAENTVLLMIAQILHAATFGSFHAVAIYLVHQFFRGNNHGQGQAFYSSISFGAGGALGAYISGYAVEALGYTTLFVSAAAVGIMAFLVAWYWVKPKSNDHE